MAIGTAVEIGFYPTSQSPLDERYLNDGQAYQSTEEVLLSIPLNSRSSYLQVNINGVLYWFLPDLQTLEQVTTSADQTASEVEIVDSEELYTSENVEDALNEVMIKVNNLESANSNAYPISLPASNSVAGRLAGYVPPVGWVIAQGQSDKDLLITHGLNRRVASVTIWAVDGTEELQLQGAAAFTGLKTPNVDSVLIMGLTNTAVALKIYLIMV